MASLKHVLITGASGGLGRALTMTALRHADTRVFAGVRDVHRAQLPTEWCPFVEQARLVPCALDVTRPAQLGEVAASLPRLDVLINNAAVCGRGSVLTDDLDEMRREFEVNYFGVLQTVRAFLPLLIASNGVIVNVASQLVRAAVPAIGNYCATKSALVAASQALRGELAETGVSIVVVCPGAMQTPMSEPFPTEKQDTQEAAREIFKALDQDEGLVPIGDQARDLLSLSLRDPVAAEQKKRPFTYRYFWG